MSRYFLEPAECSKHNLFPGVDIYTAAGEKLMMSFVEMEPGAVVEEHSHPHEQLGVLLEGELDFIIGDERRTLVAGEMWRIPGGVKHKVTAGAEPVKAIDLFHPVRDDYR